MTPAAWSLRPSRTGVRQATQRVDRRQQRTTVLLSHRMSTSMHITSINVQTQAFKRCLYRHRPVIRMLAFRGGQFARANVVLFVLREAVNEEARAPARGSWRPRRVCAAKASWDPTNHGHTQDDVRIYLVARQRSTSVPNCISTVLAGCIRGERPINSINRRLKKNEQFAKTHAMINALK
jgi:hypothetical protein